MGSTGKQVYIYLNKIKLFKLTTGRETCLLQDENKGKYAQDGQEKGDS